MRRPALVVAITALFVLLAAAACDEGGTGDDGTSEATGVVVDVQGTLTEVESFEMVLQDGTRLTLVPEAGALERAGFSPAHLREHSALAEPISVRYREADGVNIMTGLGDA